MTPYMLYVYNMLFLPMDVFFFDKDLFEIIQPYSKLKITIFFVLHNYHFVFWILLVPLSWFAVKLMSQQK